MKKIFSMLLAVSMIAMLFAGCTPKKQETAAPAATSAPKKATLVMGTNAGFEPFEYRNDKNEVVGFDVDMSKKIAEKAGQELKIEDMNFDSLITALNSGKIDMAVAGMSVTEERKQNVDFSDYYYTSKQVIVVKKGSAIKTKADLEGKKVSVQQGTTGDGMVTDDAKAATVNRFKKAVDAAMDVKNNKSDAMVLDEEPSKRIVQANEGLEILPEIFDKEEYAVAVKKGNTELLKTINATIADMKKDGSYDKLIKQYFPDKAE